MGTIRIGQSGNDTFFYPGNAPVSSGEVKKREYSDEEKEKLVESIMMMPRSKRVSALRSAGLEEEARALDEQMNEAAKPSVEGGPSDDVEIASDKADVDESGLSANNDAQAHAVEGGPSVVAGELPVVDSTVVAHEKDVKKKTGRPRKG